MSQSTRGSGLGSTPRRVVALGVVAWTIAACASADRSDGCSRDTDCPRGQVCRTQVCVPPSRDSGIDVPLPADSEGLGGGIAVE